MGEPAAVSLEPGVSALVIENVSRIFPGVRRGADVDQPRNLAKSVTVE